MKPGPYGPFPYLPIIKRPPLRWPDDARIAFWIVPNIEFFSLETRPGGIGPGKIPDIPTWALRDYGNRVGVFRMMEVLDRYKVRATVALNSDICDHHPEIIEEGNKRRWEWMGHNRPKTSLRSSMRRSTRSGGWPACGPKAGLVQDCRKLGIL
jgi:hypothetical protein